MNVPCCANMTNLLFTIRSRSMSRSQKDKTWPKSKMLAHFKILAHFKAICAEFVKFLFSML